MGNSAGPKITKDGLVLDFDAANTKSYNFYADPYASNVSLHLKMDGANGSTTFVDDSVNRYTITSYGTATISTSQSKYNGSSAYFDGSGARLGLSTTAIDFGAGDFTAECWIYISANPVTAGQIMGKHVYGVSASWLFQINASRVLSFLWNNGVNVLSTGTVLNLSQWYHVAVCRIGSTIKIFINGTEAASTTISYTFTSSTEFTIASSSNDNANARINAYIDNVRLTNAARYTASFTSPPIPSTCTDLTKNKNVGTLTNGVDYNFFNGGSLAFATSYVSSPSAASYQLGANDFTFESWIYLNAYPLNNVGVYASMIICKDQLGSRGFGFFIRGSSSVNTQLEFGGFTNNTTAASASSAYPFQLNTWYYVAASRVGNLLYLYVNGNLLNVGGTSFTPTIQSTTSEVRIGAQVYPGGYNYYVNGRIAIMKIYNGKGLTSGEVYNNFVANRGRFGV